MHRTTRKDYEGLAALLPRLRQLVDATGMVMLEPEEAAKIRMLGFQVQAGHWSVPRLPAALVAGNPLLEHLAEDSDAFWRLRQSELIPGHAPNIVEPDHVEHSGTFRGTELETPGELTGSTEASNPKGLNYESAVVLAAIIRAGTTIERRKLQKKLWRIPATRFNQAVQRLIADGVIELDGKMVKALANQGCSTSSSEPARNVPRAETGTPVKEPAARTDQI